MNTIQVFSFHSIFFIWYQSTNLAISAINPLSIQAFLHHTLYRSLFLNFQSWRIVLNRFNLKRLTIPHLVIMILTSFRPMTILMLNQVMLFSLATITSIGIGVLLWRLVLRTNSDLLYSKNYWLLMLCCYKIF